MKSVVIRAPLLSYSGYGTHSRQVFKWLLSQNVDVYTQVVPWGATSWMINPDYEDGLINEIMKRSVQMNKKPDVSFQVQLPNEWDPSLAKKNVGISAYVETDKCNPKWVLASNQMDAIVVPSTHVKSCIQATGALSAPIHVIPEAYYDSIASDNLPALDLDLSTDFNFLVVGQLTGNNPHNDRKNTYNTIKWICETFRDRDDVGIVLKTNSGKNTKIDRVVTTKLLTSLMQEVREGDFPKLHFLHGAMTQEEMAALYRHPKIKALVSLTRGEGYGLPLLEASASGLPVIATNWSGHLDFLNKGNFIKVQYQLADIHQSRIDNRIFLPGTKWAEPLEHDAKRRLMKFYEKPDIPLEWASELKGILLKEYSQDSINSAYNDALGSLLSS